MKRIVFAVTLHQKRRSKERSKEHNRLLKLGCIARLAVRQRILVVEGWNNRAARADVSETTRTYFARLHNNVGCNRKEAVDPIAYLKRWVFRLNNISIAPAG